MCSCPGCRRGTWPRPPLRTTLRHPSPTVNPAIRRPDPMSSSLVNPRNGQKYTKVTPSVPVHHGPAPVPTNELQLRNIHRTARKVITVGAPIGVPRAAVRRCTAGAMRKTQAFTSELAGMTNKQRSTTVYGRSAGGVPRRCTTGAMSKTQGSGLDRPELAGMYTLPRCNGRCQSVYGEQQPVGTGRFKQGFGRGRPKLAGIPNKQRRTAGVRQVGYRVDGGCTAGCTAGVCSVVYGQLMILLGFVDRDPGAVRLTPDLLAQAHHKSVAADKPGSTVSDGGHGRFRGHLRACSSLSVSGTAASRTSGTTYLRYCTVWDSTAGSVRQAVAGLYGLSTVGAIPWPQPYRQSQPVPVCSSPGPQQCGPGRRRSGGSARLSCAIPLNLPYSVGLTGMCS